MDDKIWDGAAVGVVQLPEQADRRPVSVRLTRQAARTLAIVLARMTQTTFALPGDVEELRQALNYVTTDDAIARRAHDRMEAGKGMTPDGGYKAPENRSPITGEDISDYRKPTGPRYT